MKSVPVGLLKIRASTRALVDDEDYEKVMAFKWLLNDNGYAIASEIIGRKYGNNVRRTLRMHRLIMNVQNEKRDVQVDHKNRNKLDNRKGNLRICGYLENSWNQRVNCKSSTGIKGVERNGKGFIARITNNGTRRNLGTYKTKEEAGAVYRAEAIRLRGEFGYDFE